MEDLDVAYLLRNHNVVKNIVHASFARCITVMKSKCNKFGIPFMQAPKDYPSSQICSCCGHIRKIGKSKTYRCDVCGAVIDRDINAAINLEHLAYS